MTDDQLLLASAYLDGDLDAAGRARAEADAEVMAEVERQRTVQAMLRDVEPPDPARRDRAIAAALGSFGAAPAGAPAPPPAPVPLPERPRRAWWGVAAAAAVVAVLGAGLVAVVGGGPSGHDDAGAPAASELLAERDQTLSAQSDEEDGEGGEGGDSAQEAPAAPSQDDAADATLSEAVEGTTASADTSPDTTASASGGVDTALPRLSTREQLAEFADRSAGEVAEGTPECAAAGRFIGRAIYGDVPVEVFADGTTVIAVHAGTCAVVITING